MKKIWMLSFVFLMFSCGTKYHYWDTGISDGHFEGTMYEFLKNDHENWDSIVKVIEKADLAALFEKENITFLAPTNFVFWKWFYYDDKNGGYDQAISYVPHGYKCIDEMSQEICRRIVLSHIVDGKLMRNDVPRVTYNELGERNGGGVILTTRYGNKIWIWSVKEPYMNIPDMGPVILDMSSLKEDETVYRNVGIASPDHEPYNGVVHSLPYTYKLGDLCDILNAKN